MGWGQTTRVLLVWPLRGRILARRLDLVLLKRHSEALGSQLALVTRDYEARYQARKLEIPVYRNIQEAEQSRWSLRGGRRSHKPHAGIPDPSKRKELSKSALETRRSQVHPAPPRWLTRPLTRFSFFTLGVLSMLVIAALFIPSAEIHVAPAARSDAVTISVAASPEQKTVELSGAVPAYWQTVVVEGRGSAPATGETLIPRQTATGEVAFTNLTDEPLTIPLGTVVSTQGDPPIRFRTVKAATIPTGPLGATVPVEAIQPGSSGNVAAETIIAIEGPLGLNLAVRNPASTTGGSDYTAAAPSMADAQLVYEQLFAALQVTALSELGLRLEAGDVLLSDTPILLQTLEETYSPAIGQPADQIELRLRLEFQMPYASGADLYQLGRMVLDHRLPQNFEPHPETLQIIQPSELGKTTWKMQARWELGAMLDEAKAISLVLGLTPEQAIQQLGEQMPIEDVPEIRLKPSWWPRLPILPARIQLIDTLAPVSNPNTPE